MKNKSQNYIAAAMLALFASMSHAAQIDVTATQTVTNTAFGANVKAITANTTWTKDNVYILKDKVFVSRSSREPRFIRHWIPKIRWARMMISLVPW
jgi:hypothetical protein